MDSIPYFCCMEADGGSLSGRAALAPANESRRCLGQLIFLREPGLFANFIGRNAVDLAVALDGDHFGPI